MIVTVTMNPSVDISYQLDKLVIDKVNRIPNAIKTPGGKGLNVAKVLNELGANTITTGLIGGRLGQYIIDELDKLNINSSFYNISGNTRNCVAILHEGKQTEINEGGPTITDEESKGFINHLNTLLDKSNYVTLSGSLPNGLNLDYYEKLIHLTDTPVLLDTSGKALELALKSDKKPFLIKPNNDEISELLGRDVTKDTNDLIAALNDSLFAGIEWIVVSLGSKGALAKHNDRFYKANIPSVEVINPVGSGDSTVAGLAYALDKNLSDKEVLKYGMTCGVLNAMEEKTGHINKDNFEEIYSKVIIEEIKY